MGLLGTFKCSRTPSPPPPLNPISDERRLLRPVDFHGVNYYLPGGMTGGKEIEGKGPHLNSNYFHLVNKPLGITSVKNTSGMPDSFQFKDTGYGVSNPLHSGWNSARSQLASNHPLEAAIKNFKNDQIKINNSVMLHAQGPAAPLIQAMELRAVKQVGRHPFLASSNFQLEVLTGRDLEMDFDDFLNVEEFKEIQAQPHIMMENLPLKPVF